MAKKNPKIILVEPHAQKRKLLALNFTVYLGAEVIGLQNADDVQNHINKVDKNIDLIVSTDIVHEENTILKVYYFINSNKHKIPIILMGESPKLKGSVEQIEPYNWQKIIKTSAKMLGITAKDMANLEVPEYYPFPIEQFIPVIESPVDIYEIDPADDSETGFKLLFEKEEKVNHELINDYIVKKIPELYVKREERLKFAESFSEQIKEYLTDGNLKIEERSKLTAMVYQDAVNRVKEIGMDAYAIDQCKATIDSMTNIAQSTNKLSDLLNMIVQSGDSYMYRHSLLASILGTRVTQIVDWGNDEQAQKLCFVAFFHDFMIPEDDFCRIHSKQELDLLDASDADKKRIERHALDCCELLKDYPGVPYGAESLILQHHGMLNGIGFSSKLQMRLSTLAMVHMVCEEAAHFLMENEPSKSNSKKLLDMLYKKYDKVKYLETVEALKEIFKAGV